MLLICSVLGECGAGGATPPLPASAVAAVRSPNGTARRAARSVRRIGRGFYGVGHAEREGEGRACYGRDERLPCDPAPRRPVLVRGLRQRRPATRGRRLRARRERDRLRPLDLPLSRYRGDVPAER